MCGKGFEGTGIQGSGGEEYFQVRSLVFLDSWIIIYIERKEALMLKLTVIFTLSAFTLFKSRH